MTRIGGSEATVRGGWLAGIRRLIVLAGFVTGVAGIAVPWPARADTCAGEEKAAEAALTQWEIACGRMDDAIEQWGKVNDQCAAWRKQCGGLGPGKEKRECETDYKNSQCTPEEYKKRTQNLGKVIAACMKAGEAMTGKNMRLNSCRLGQKQQW